MKNYTMTGFPASQPPLLLPTGLPRRVSERSVAMGLGWQWWQGLRRALRHWSQIWRAVYLLKEARELPSRERGSDHGQSVCQGHSANPVSGCRGDRSRLAVSFSVKSVQSNSFWLKNISWKFSCLPCYPITPGFTVLNCQSSPKTAN